MCDAKSAIAPAAASGSKYTTVALTTAVIVAGRS
jgi:hypothetical protein